MSYTRAPGNGVIRISDNQFIDQDPASSDWQDFLDWQAGGGILGDYAGPINVWDWFIDIGPFFDRFAAAKMSVLTSAHPVAKAVVTDCMVRKWIDLQNPAVSAGIDALIAVGVAGVTTELKSAILNTVVQDIERVALRKLFFPD